MVSSERLMAHCVIAAFRYGVAILLVHYVLKDALMILHGVPLSPFVRKVMFMLDELGLAFEQKMVLPQGEAADFRRVSPLGRIPALEDGDFNIFDSSAICHYLSVKQASPLMGAGDAQRAARIVGVDKYADEDLAPQMLTLVIEQIVKPTRMNQLPDEALIEHVLDEKLPPVLDRLEARLAADTTQADSPWFVGPDFSFADMAVAGHLTALSLVGTQAYLTRWPALSAWYERALARPCIATTMAAAERFMAGE